MTSAPLTVLPSTIVSRGVGCVWRAMLAGFFLLTPARGEKAVSYAFEIAASDAEAALKQFSAQSGQQVLVPTELVNAIRTRAVHGEFTAQAALDRLFASTPVVAVADPTSGAFAIVRRSPPARQVPVLNAAAVIVVGLATDEVQAQRFRRAAEVARDGLAARGIPPAAIILLPSDPATQLRRDAILAAARGVKSSVDETWLVLFGNAAAGRDREPVFQVSGPRLSAQDLATAVGALPGRKFVVLALARSGGFLPSLLPVPNVEAVAATAEAGEVNEPRFAQMWPDALAANSDASFRDLAIEAANRVERFYRNRRLGQGEHAELLDRAAGRIVAVSSPEAPTAAAGTPLP